MSQDSLQSAKDKQLHKNYETYKANKAEFLLEYGKDRFLLMRNQKVIDVFDTQAFVWKE